MASERSAAHTSLRDSLARNVAKVRSWPSYLRVYSSASILREREIEEQVREQDARRAAFNRAVEQASEERA